jgi:hypothetical protein
VCEFKEAKQVSACFVEGSLAFLMAEEEAFIYVDGCYEGTHTIDIFDGKKRVHNILGKTSFFSRLMCLCKDVEERRNDGGSSLLCPSMGELVPA